MHGIPDSEVERDLHPRLIVVKRPRNLDLDGNALRVRVDLTDVGDAFRAPKEAEELFGETRVTEPHVHASHSL